MTEPTITQPADMNRLYVANCGENIPFRTIQEELHKLFSRAGTVTNVYIPSNSEGLSCGYGFVQMLDDKGKNKAIQMFNGYLLNDQALAVKIAWLSKAWLSNRTISSWDEFVELAGQYVDSGQLEAEEITYKLKVGELGTAARTAVLSGADDWIDRVKALVSGTVNLIIHYRIRPIEGWLDAHPNDALEALRILWERSDQLVTERIRVFSERLPRTR